MVYQDVLSVLGVSERADIRFDFLFDSQLLETATRTLNDLRQQQGLEGSLCPWCIFLDNVSLVRVILVVGKSTGTSPVSF